LDSTLAHVPSDEETIMIATARTNRPSGSFWTSRREAALNWLALGMLLAAWNASDSESAQNAPSRAEALSKPAALRGYAHVSVRAANRLIAADR
jgi:hypothetical protein